MALWIVLSVSGDVSGSSSGGVATCVPASGSSVRSASRLSRLR